MKYNIRGDKMLITDAIKDYTETKLGKLEKYFKDDDITANVLAKVRGNSQIVEVTIPTSKFILRSEEESDDLYAAIDLVSDKLERQVRKNKTKLKNIRKNNGIVNIDDLNTEGNIFKDYCGDNEKLNPCGNFIEEAKTIASWTNSASSNASSAVLSLGFSLSGFINMDTSLHDLKIFSLCSMLR